MRKYGPSVLLLAALAIVLTLACGSSSPMLRSVSLSPPTADAQGNPVQFVATGYFSQQPSPVKLTKRLLGERAIRINPTYRLPPSRLAPTAWLSAHLGRLARIQFGPWPSAAAAPASQVSGKAQLTCP